MAAQLVTVTGVKEIDRKMGQLEPKLQKKILRQASRKAVKDFVLHDALAAVPVDSGELEASIKLKAIKRSRGKIGHRVVSGAEGTGPAWYGKFVELGSKRQPAQKFMRTALYGNRRNIIKTFINEIRAKLKALVR